MTDQERARIGELLRLAQCVCCKAAMLISHCQDADGRVIADEATVRAEMRQSVATLVAFTTDAP